MRGKSKGVINKTARRNDVTDIASSLSAAHICHFPCDERTGDSQTDVVNGTVVHKAVGSQSFGNPYAITCNGGNTDSSKLVNNLRDVREGVFIYYSSSDWNLATAGGNYKESFYHLVPNARWMLDLEVDESTVTTPLGTVWRPRVLFGDSYAQNTWACPVDDLREIDDGKHSLVIMLTIGEGPSGMKTATHYGKVTQGTYAPNSDTEVLDRILLNPTENNTTIPTTAKFEPTHKWMDLYCWGAYNFVEYVPSDDELRAAARWFYEQPRAGNKQAYPPWADKR